MHILVASIPMQGHVAPLLALAAELVRRSHRVTFVSLKNEKIFGRHTDNWEAEHESVRFVFAGDVRLIDDGLWSEAYEDALYAGLCQPSVVQAVLAATKFAGVIASWMRHQQGPLDALLEASDDPIDLVLADYVTVGAHDAAQLHGIPVMINWPGLKMPFASAGFASYSVLDFRVPMASPLHRFASHALFHLLFYLRDRLCVGPVCSERYRLHAQRGGVAPLGEMSTLWKSTPILYNTAVGVSEISQYYSPLEHHVGALLPASRRQGGASLEGSVLDFLESAPPAGALLVNFGTAGTMAPWKWEVLLGALEGLPAADRPAVLWRISEARQQQLFGVHHPPPYVRIVRWISPSQGAVLCHPSLKVFVSHAGINSPQEAIECGVPLLMMPSFGDQAGHGARLEAAGLGISMGTGRFSTATLLTALQRLLRNHSTFAAATSEARDRLRAAGGTARAADIVEQTHRLGYKHLVPGDAHLPFLQGVVHLDIMVGYMCVLAIPVLALQCLTRLGRLCCRRARQPKQQQQQHGKRD